MKNILSGIVIITTTKTISTIWKLRKDDHKCNQKIIKFTKRKENWEENIFNSSKCHFIVWLEKIIFWEKKILLGTPNSLSVVNKICVFSLFFSLYITGMVSFIWTVLISKQTFDLVISSERMTIYNGLSYAQLSN